MGSHAARRALVSHSLQASALRGALHTHRNNPGNRLLSGHRRRHRLGQCFRGRGTGIGSRQRIAFRQFRPPRTPEGCSGRRRRRRRRSDVPDGRIALRLPANPVHVAAARALPAPAVRNDRGPRPQHAQAPLEQVFGNGRRVGAIQHSKQAADPHGRTEHGRLDRDSRWTLVHRRRPRSHAPRIRYRQRTRTVARETPRSRGCHADDLCIADDRATICRHRLRRPLRYSRPAHRGIRNCLRPAPPGNLWGGRKSRTQHPAASSQQPAPRRTTCGKCSTDARSS